MQREPPSLEVAKAMHEKCLQSYLEAEEKIFVGISKHYADNHPFYGINMLSNHLEKKRKEFINSCPWYAYCQSKEEKISLDR